MAKTINPEIVENFEAGVAYPFFAINLEFDSGDLRLWTGLGTLNYNGEVYTGTGELLDISPIEETSDISARGATLTLSGIPSSLVSTALQETYQGRIGTIYLGTFTPTRDSILKEDSDFILLESGGKIYIEENDKNLVEIFSGYIDQMNINEGPETSTIQTTLENRLIDLERPKAIRYTTAYQKSIYPGDLGLNFVESLQDKPIFWGKES